jgi:hypothetical protein
MNFENQEMPRAFPGYRFLSDAGEPGNGAQHSSLRPTVFDSRRCDNGAKLVTFDVHRGRSHGPFDASVDGTSM